MDSQEQANGVFRTIEHGEASELPVPVWSWRRWFAFAVTAGLLYLAWVVTGKTADVATLRDIARYSLGLVGLVIFVYVAGATATDVVSLVAAVRTTRKETIAQPPAAS